MKNANSKTVGGVEVAIPEGDKSLASQIRFCFQMS
jgi:hypothetical protein